jgi:hypothetical protein
VLPAPSSLSTEGCSWDRNPSVVLALPVSLASKLRVTGAQAQHMPLYVCGGGQAGRTTTTDACSRHNRISRRGGQLQQRAHGP